jgi:hypothetical protein
MAAGFTRGKWAILLMFLAVSVYVGALMLMVEPTVWRTVPPEGMSRNGAAWHEGIAELRLYRMPRRGFPFYFEDELAPAKPLARIDNPETVKLILDLLKDRGPGDKPAWCRRVKSDAWLHVVTLLEDKSVFGYVILAPGKKRADAPPYLSGCGVLITDRGGTGVDFADVYGAFEAIGEITGLQLKKVFK